MTRTVELTIPCVRGYETIAMNAAAEFARLLPFPSDRIDDLRTAVAEACINAMEHGNAMEGSSTVVLVMHATTDRLAVEVADEGRGAPPPATVSTPDVAAWADGTTVPRGMGLFVISALVDESGFVDNAPDGGTTFRMVIHVDAHEEEDR